MTDRDVIWARPNVLDETTGRYWTNNHLVDGQRVSEAHPPFDTEPYIPLARAQDLQRALTSVAEGLEDYWDAKRSGDRAAPDPLAFIADTARTVRRLLNRFERTDQGEGR